MGMDLRILRPTRPVLERRHHQLGLLARLSSLPSSRPRKIVFEVAQGFAHRLVMRPLNQDSCLLVRERPGNRHRLRSREGQIPAWLMVLPSRVLNQIVTIWIVAAQQVAELFGLDLARQSQPLGSAPRPLPWRLTALQVIVLAPEVEIVLSLTLGFYGSD